MHIRSLGKAVIGLFVTLLAALALVAQTPPVTRQEMLRGTITPEREARPTEGAPPSGRRRDDLHREAILADASAIVGERSARPAVAGDPGSGTADRTDGRGLDPRMRRCSGR